MVNQARRQGVQFKVTHTIATHHHRSVLLVEGIDNLLEGLRRGIEVIGIQLHCKPATPVIIDRHIPAPANTQVVAFGYDMNQPLVVHTVKQFCGLVGGMVIHHNDIKPEVGLLS